LDIWSEIRSETGVATPVVCQVDARLALASCELTMEEKASTYGLATAACAPGKGATLSREEKNVHDSPPQTVPTQPAVLSQLSIHC
jgi:hypothetical protein